MMKLFQYSSMYELNKALETFDKEKIPVKKVKVLTVADGSGSEEIVYFVLIDTSGTYQ